MTTLGMIDPFLSVSIFYVVPLLLAALILCARPRYPAWLLVVVLAALPVFYIGHYRLYERLAGWPSDAPLPDRFELVAFDIREPDPRRDTAGHIVIWARTDGGPRWPRAHRVAYDKQLHGSLIAAGQRSAEGKTQIGIRRPTPHATAAADRIANEKLNFRDRQPRALPAKDPEP